MALFAQPYEVDKAGLGLVGGQAYCQVSASPLQAGTWLLRNLQGDLLLRSSEQAEGCALNFTGSEPLEWLVPQSGADCGHTALRFLHQQQLLKGGRLDVLRLRKLRDKLSGSNPLPMVRPQDIAEAPRPIALGQGGPLDSLRWEDGMLYAGSSPLGSVRANERGDYLYFYGPQGEDVARLYLADSTVLRVTSFKDFVEHRLPSPGASSPAAALRAAAYLREKGYW